MPVTLQVKVRNNCQLFTKKNVKRSRETGLHIWTCNLTVLPDWLLISGLIVGPIAEFLLYIYLILYFLNCIYDERLSGGLGHSESIFDKKTNSGNTGKFQLLGAGLSTQWGDLKTSMVQRKLLNRAGHFFGNIFFLKRHVLCSLASKLKQGFVEWKKDTKRDKSIWI